MLTHTHSHTHTLSLCHPPSLSPTHPPILPLSVTAQNVDTFLFEMSHQKTQKKKVIYTVERTFPYIKSRLEICKTDELILSPIEAAIEVCVCVCACVCVRVRVCEMMKRVKDKLSFTILTHSSSHQNVTDRVKAIRVELSAAVPRINTLQQVPFFSLLIFYHSFIHCLAHTCTRTPIHPFTHNSLFRYCKGVSFRWWMRALWRSVPVSESTPTHIFRILARSLLSLSWIHLFLSVLLPCTSITLTLSLILSLPSLTSSICRFPLPRGRWSVRQQGRGRVEGCVERVHSQLRLCTAAQCQVKDIIIRLFLIIFDKFILLFSFSDWYWDRLIDEKHKPFQDMCNQKYEELVSHIWIDRLFSSFWTTHQSKMIKKYIDWWITWRCCLVVVRKGCCCCVYACLSTKGGCACVWIMGLEE